MGKTTVQAPAPLDPAKVGADTLETQLRLAPDVFAANAEYLPRYADLALQVAGRTIPALTAQQAEANTAQRSADIADVRNLGGQALEAWRAANPQLTGAQESLGQAIAAAGAAGAPQVGRYTAAAPALAAAATPAAARIGPMATAAAPRLGRVSTYAAPTVGPAARATGGPAAAPGLEATASATPSLYSAATAAGSRLLPQLETDAGATLGQVSPLQIRLQQQAMEMLGAELSPAELAKVQQDTRAAYAARGLYDSNQAIGAEILNTDAARRARRLENAAFAQGVDASSQQQLQAGRTYAGNVAGMGGDLSRFNAAQTQGAAADNAAAATSTSQFNAGERNRAGLTRYGTEAGLNQFNAGLSADLSRFNAGATNELAALQAQLGARAGEFNAGARNQANLTRYGTQAGLNQFNVGALNTATLGQAQLDQQASLTGADAANRFALTRYGTEADLARFNAGQNLQTDQTNAQLAAAARQQNIANLFNQVNQYAATAQDPYQLVLGRSGAPATGLALSRSAGPTMFDPFDQSITSIYAGNQANELAARTATANNRAALWSAGLNFAGNLFG